MPTAVEAINAIVRIFRIFDMGVSSILTVAGKPARPTKDYESALYRRDVAHSVFGIVDVVLGSFVRRYMAVLSPIAGQTIAGYAHVT